MARSLPADAVLPLAISACAVFVQFGTLRWLCANWRSALYTKALCAHRTRLLRNMVQMRMMDQVSPELKRKL